MSYLKAILRLNLVLIGMGLLAPSSSKSILIHKGLEIKNPILKHLMPFIFWWNCRKVKSIGRKTSPQGRWLIFLVSLACIFPISLISIPVAIGGIIGPPISKRTATEWWNAAEFEGATDVAKIKEAITEARLKGRGAVWLGGKTNWEITEAIKVSPATRISGRGYGVSTKLEATGNFFIFELGEGGDASEIALEWMLMRASAKQASGGAISWAAASGGEVAIENMRFGSNLKNTITTSTFGAGNVWLRNLLWNDGATNVKGCGTAIKVGDGNAAHHIVGWHMFNVEGYANEAKDMEVWLDINFTDSMGCWESLFFKGENGIRIGAASAELSTGLKFVNTTSDSMSVTGWKFQNVRDYELASCNAQTCGTKLVGVGYHLAGGANAGKFRGGTCQNCQNHGFIAVAGAKHFDVVGMDISDNNKANEGGSGFVIAGGVSEWTLSHSRIGNFLALAGKQQFGVFIEAGASDSYSYCDNTFSGNEIAAIENLGTGLNVTARGNVTTGGSKAPGAKTKRKTAEAIKASKVSDVQVTLTAETAAVTRTSLEIFVSGVLIATPEISVAATGKSFITISFTVPLMNTYEVKIKEGTLEPANEFETAYLAL